MYNVIQGEPEMSDEQQAMLAADNSGLDVLFVPTKATRGEVIEILDDNEEEVMNKYEQEEVSVNVGPDKTNGATAELVSDTRRSG